MVNMILQNGIISVHVNMHLSMKQIWLMFSDTEKFQCVA